MMLFLYRLELACAHKFLACEGVYMQGEGATAEQGCRRGLIFLHQCPKACRENVSFVENELYTCVCACVHSSSYC